MSRESIIPQALMTGSLLHFESGVPIDDLDLRREHKERLMRVKHVYWQWMRNPFLDVFVLFKQLVKGKYADKYSEWRAAQKDKWLFDFVVERVASPSRRMDEAKVRAAADHVMRIGMETDNGKDIIEGAKLLTKVARLDQPEDQNADMSKVAFLPTVVVTNVNEVDDTKENYDDEETKRIIAKYGAFVDDKRKAIEDNVALMEARGSSTGPSTDGERGDSVDNEESGCDHSQQTIK